MTMQYARCNWMLSLALDENGQPCRFMATADTTDGVVSSMSTHIESVHSVDPGDLQNNIRAVTKTTKTKSLGTRPPGGH
jgi:predicted small metal-binding protein